MVGEQCQLPFPYGLSPRSMLCGPLEKAEDVVLKKFAISSLLFGTVVIQTMIFLTLLYLCFFSGSWNTLALPTDLRPPDIPSKTHLHSILLRDDSFDSRSTYGILWSCLSTIFACTWITVHPNIPAPGDSEWTIIRRRLAIMGYFLLTPELVILWAARQQFVVRCLTKKHENNHTGWTRAHSFFLIMGGFMLHEGGKPVRVLEAKDLEELSEAGKIKWPTITKEEIADRSKGDYLSKTIVLFQTTWFIGQCIARGANGLTVTELEVVTVAFASLTGVIYYLWWDKPLDVRCSIPVHLLEGHLGKIEGDLEKEETGPQVIPSPNISADETDASLVVNPNPLLTTSIQADTTTPDLLPPRMQRFRAFRRCTCEEYGSSLGLAYVFIGFPLKRFLSTFEDTAGCETLGDKRLRVPTFYSPYNKDDPRQFIPIASAMCVAIVFGAIHCIPWSFQFATLQERWVWRISAILVVGTPISFIVIHETFYYPRNNLTRFFRGPILCGLIFLYVIARIVLLVLAFVALRALPPDAYVQLDWISFLPHI